MTRKRGRPRNRPASRNNLRHAQLNRLTPAASLTGDVVQWAIERGVEAAFSDGLTAVVVGMTSNDRLMVCTAGCCLRRRGTFIVVPDVVIAEGVANGHEAPNTFRIRRDDGREAYLFRSAR